MTNDSKESGTEAERLRETLQEALEEAAEKSEELRRQTEALHKLRDVSSETAHALNSDLLLDLLLKNLTRRVELLESELKDAVSRLHDLRSDLDSRQSLNTLLGEKQDERLDHLEVRERPEILNFFDRMFPKGFSTWNITLISLLLLVLVVGLFQALGFDVPAVLSDPLFE